MNRRARLALMTAPITALALLALAAPAWSGNAPEIYPLEKIRRGQKGYGLTTFQGTTPERFEFEVIGVNKNFLPKMDIILVKSDDPKLAITGFWRGMSGSPLFIDGKVACAFSYGFRFNKVAIGGCTPLDYMTREGFQQPRGMLQGNHGTASKTKKRATSTTRRPAPQSAASPKASIDDWLRVAPQRTVASAMNNLGEPRTSWLGRAPLPHAAPRQVPDNDLDEGMTAAAVPLAMSGFSAPAFAQAKTLMGQFPIEPMRAQVCRPSAVR
jgi:hypothetical protein